MILNVMSGIKKRRIKHEKKYFLQKKNALKLSHHEEPLFSFINVCSKLPMRYEDIK